MTELRRVTENDIGALYTRRNSVLEEVAKLHDTGTMSAKQIWVAQQGFKGDFLRVFGRHDLLDELQQSASRITQTGRKVVNLTRFSVPPRKRFWFADVMLGNYMDYWVNAPDLQREEKGILLEPPNLFIRMYDIYVQQIEPESEISNTLPYQGMIVEAVHPRIIFGPKTGRGAASSLHFETTHDSHIVWSKESMEAVRIHNIPVPNQPELVQRALRALNQSYI